MNHIQIETSSIMSIAEGIRNGNLTSKDLAEWTIANRKNRGSTLNAYKTWKPEQQLSESAAADAVFLSGIDLGPLQGIPVSVKDLYGVKGYPTFAGCSRELPEKWQAEGPVIRSCLLYTSPSPRD